MGPLPLLLVGKFAHPISSCMKQSAVWTQAAHTGNLFIEISRVQGPVGDIEKLCAAMGADRVLFGSNLPIHVPEAAKLAIEHANISAGDRRLIARDNAARLFGL